MSERWWLGLAYAISMYATKYKREPLTLAVCFRGPETQSVPHRYRHIRSQCSSNPSMDSSGVVNSKTGMGGRDALQTRFLGKTRREEFSVSRRHPFPESVARITCRRDLNAQQVALVESETTE